METGDEKIIELSKTKILLGILGSIAFAVAGVWLLTLDAELIRTGDNFRLFFNNPAVAYGLGFAAIVVFGILALFFFRKLFNKEPGLILNSSGIVDNASAASAGFIPWADVLGSEVFEMQKQKMLVVMVTDPEKYVGRGNAIKQKLNKANYNMVGSPITISASTLKTNFSELRSLFEEYQRKYGNRDSVNDRT
jgi:hypothetical protein